MDEYKYVVGRIFCSSGEDEEFNERPEYLAKGRWVSDISKAHVFKTRRGAQKASRAVHAGRVVAIHPQYVSELFEEAQYAN